MFKRDGLELESNFTATVNVELKVGGLEETVTVSGETPLVDTQNMTQQTTHLQDAARHRADRQEHLRRSWRSCRRPSRRPTQQDVGGSLGEPSMRISVHGAKPNDSRLLMDGLSYNMATATGPRGFYDQPAERPGNRHRHGLAAARPNTASAAPSST